MTKIEKKTLSKTLKLNNQEETRQLKRVKLPQNKTNNKVSQFNSSHRT